MAKRTLIILGYSIVVTGVIITILVLTKGLFLDRIVHLIMKTRGTTNYEGEDKGTEVWNIIMGMIFPAVFLLSISVVALFSRKKD